MSLVTQEKSSAGESESPTTTPLSDELTLKECCDLENLMYYGWEPGFVDAVDGIPVIRDYWAEVTRAPMFTVKPNRDAGAAHHQLNRSDYVYCDVCWTQHQMPFHDSYFCGSKEPVLWGFL